jgi:hypothetical protein
MRTALLLLLFGTLSAAVPGIPEPPAPGPIPEVTLGWFNDWHAIPTTHSDDHRTNAFIVGIRIDDWVYQVDDSMLTSRELGVRNDELSLTAGYIIANDESASIVLGGGVRLRGDYGGESTQNWWHSQWRDYPVHLAYEDSVPSPILYMMNHLRTFPLNDHSLEIIADGEVLSDALAVDLGLRDVVFLNDAGDIRIWFGPRWQFREDWQDNQIGPEIARFERGLWIDYGIQIGHFSLGERHAIGRSEGMGTISWSCGF